MARVGDLSALSETDRLDDEAEQARAVAECRTSASRQSYYWVQSVDQLPHVDLSITLVSRLFCRHGCAEDRFAFNARVLAFVDRWLAKLQLLMLITVPSIMAMFFVGDPAVQAATSIVAFCTSMPLITLSYAMLSYDMSKLVVRTFEFWFLTAANVVNTIVFFSMFRDARVVGIVSGFLFLQLTFFTDANLRTRLVELRFLVFGAPGLLVVIIACSFRITPGLHSSFFHIWGASVADVDLLLSGNFIIAFFTTRKTHRNRHLRSPKHRGDRHIVQCQMYFPTCRLVALDAHTVSRLRAKTARENDAFTRRKSKVQGTTIEYQQTLHMMPSSVADAFDVDRLVVPMANCRLMRREDRLVQWTLNSLAVVGAAFATLTHAASMFRFDLPLVSSNPSQQFAVEIIGLVATLATTLLYFFNCQPDLLRMLVSEVDAWFAAVHFTMVVICMADIVHWRHDAIPVLSAWVWSMWILLLDAVPPVARRRLGFQRWLLLLVNALLMLFHVSLLHALFVSSSSAHATERAEATLRNRVLVDFKIGALQLRLEMFSFATSKIFTSFVWTGRFLWRESVRPHDGFKLIKHRAQFLIPLDQRSMR